MNERIRELAEQARKHFPKTEMSGEFWVFDEEKFAELIVGGCINWIDGSPTTEEGSLILSKHFIIANLKHHLGIEE